jgi:hypothetical protein
LEKASYDFEEIGGIFFMKKTYSSGTTWEAISSKKLYKIVYDPVKYSACYFHVSITNKDGTYLGMKDHWLHYTNFGTIRGATNYCRRAYFEILKFKKVKK